MKKEVIIAIIIGITIGTIITLGVHIAQKSLAENSIPPTNPSTPSITISPSQAVHNLIITSPNNASVTEQSEIEIIGNTSPNSLLSVISGTNQAVGSADIEGNFEFSFSLSSGANQIIIKSFDQNGQEASQEIEVIYLDNQPVEITPTPAS
jgi:hypothetical protein